MRNSVILVDQIEQDIESAQPQWGPSVTRSEIIANTCSFQANTTTKMGTAMIPGTTSGKTTRNRIELVRARHQQEL